MKPRRTAFTLIETTIASAIVALAGGSIYTILLTGTILFTKNTAVNLAHQQARVALLGIERNLHTSASVPQLVDINRNNITGNGPAAGISFHRYAGGPFQVAPGTTVTPAQNQISVKTDGWVPTVGMRLNIPTHSIEQFVTACMVSGNTVVVTLANTAGTSIYTTMTGAAGAMAVNIPCFFTDLASYVVVSGELRYYPTKTSTHPTSLCQDITSPTPFSVPVTTAGAAYNRFVAAVNLSTADLNSTNRQYKAANMFLNSQVPYRAKLTQTQ
jgi:hypothetical protein